MITIKATEAKQFEESKFISPGVHDVKITAINAVEPEGKSAYLNFTFENTKGQTTDDKLYFTKAAEKYSIDTIGEIMTACGVTSDISGADVTETAKKLFKAIGNKTFKHRFTAEEIQGKLDTETGKQKNNWFKAKMGRKFSSESTSANPSRLKPLDKANKYDYKMLPQSDVIASSNDQASSDDLPF